MLQFESDVESKLQRKKKNSNFSIVEAIIVNKHTECIWLVPKKEKFKMKNW